MKITIEAQTLVNCLKIVSPLIEKPSKKRNITILGCVVIKTENGRAVFSATNLDVEHSVSAICDVEQDGIAVLNHNTLLGFAKLTDPTHWVTIETTESNLTAKLACGDKSEIVLAFDPKDHPNRAKLEGNICDIGFDTNDLLEALKNTRISISTEETRYYLNGVFMHVGESNGLTFVATDGHRLVKQEVPDSTPEKHLPPHILRPACINQLVRNLKGATGVSCQASGTRTKWYFTDKNGLFHEITGLSVDGVYPDYSRVLPKKENISIKFKASELLNSVQLAGKSLDEDYKCIRLTYENGKITINSTDMNITSNTNCIADDTKPIERFELGFNWQYLESLLGLFGDSIVTWSIDEMGGPHVLKSISHRDLLAVVMPMRLPGEMIVKETKTGSTRIIKTRVRREPVHNEYNLQHISDWRDYHTELMRAKSMLYNAIQLLPKLQEKRKLL